MVRTTHWPTLLGAALILVLLVSACGAAPTATPAPAPTMAPPPTATTAPAPAATTAPAATATTATTVPAATATTASNPAPAPAGAMHGLAAASNSTLGNILTDDTGMTLYLYTKDVPNKSNCYNGCATAWPPFLVKEDSLPAAPAGFTGTFSQTERTDGSYQLTYDGWPLYYYAKDKNPGDVVGQGVGGVWYVFNTSGSTAPAGTPTAAVAPTKAAAPAAGLMVAHDAKLGDILTDAKGMVLYLYTKDTADKSNCYNGCATAWPPFLIAEDQLPAAPAGFTGKFAQTERTDGAYQLTYNGLPLYYYAKDKNPGDTTGQGVGSVWYVITPQSTSGGSSSGGYSGG